MQSQRPTIEHEFDVFVKDSPKGWHFDSRIKASSLEQAKLMFLRENPVYPGHYVTVYPRR